MTMIEHTGEALARRISRRRLLNRWAAAAFGMAAAWAVEGFHVRSASALACEVRDRDHCHCRYDIAPGCGSTEGCTLDTSYYQSTGCWCTLTCRYGRNLCGHHVCCDYLCPGISGQCIGDTFVRDACPKGKRSIARGWG